MTSVVFGACFGVSFGLVFAIVKLRYRLATVFDKQQKQIDALKRELVKLK